MGLAALALVAAGPPTIVPVLPAGLAVPIAAPYDATADAHQAVAQALGQARRTGKRVVLDFGGNWCPDCRMLGGVLAIPAVDTWVRDHFVLVRIDVGRKDRNLDIAAGYGVTITAVPTVLVVTADKRLVNGAEVFGLADARHVSAQAVVDLLARWAGG